MSDLKEKRKKYAEKMFSLKKFKVVIKASRKKNIGPDESVFLDKVNSLIEKNISDPEFSASSLKNTLKISRISLYRRLNKLTGMMPNKYICFIRIQRASKLLVNEYVSVSEVAYSVGFRDLGHFSKSFKKHFGLTPAQFLVKEGKEIRLRKNMQ